MKSVIRYSEEISLSHEGPFPAKIFLSQKDTSSASVRMCTLEKGKKIELHAHSSSDQLEYCLEGKALMFIEDLGNVELRKGAFTYIPKGVKHSVLEISKSLILITVFVPPFF